MSTTTIQTTEGASPVAAAPAVTPAASATVPHFETPHDFEKALQAGNLDDAALEALLTTPFAKPTSGYTSSLPEDPKDPRAPVAPVEVPVLAAEVTPAADPVAPAATKDDDDSPQPEKLGRFRLSARDFKEAEFLRLAKSMPVTEAYAKAYGTPTAPTAAATPDAAPVAPAPVADAKLTEAKTKLADLETKLTQAQEDADLGTVTKLMREIGKTERVIETAEHEAVAAQKSQADAAQNTFRQREAAVAQEVYAAFPKLGDPTSPENAEFKQFIDLKAGDPDYASIFTSPRWPKVMANEFAEAKGWGKAAAPVLPTGNPAPKPGAPAAPRVTAAEVLTPGSNQGGASINAETFVQDISKMSMKDLDAILMAAR